MLALIMCTGTPRLAAQDLSRASAFKSEESWVEPLHIAPRLSGNFGELRGNHFHTGVDLKTEGREGLVVVAATDGRVARVKMSPWGYGNALYLEGPGGITTVYAHLQRFVPKIQDWAVTRTYRGRSLGLDAAPSAADDLVFQAGDTLGWSGNSGGSGGPHLHFEVRNTANQHPLNPLDGWLTKTDTRPPRLPVLWAESEGKMRSWALTNGDTLATPVPVRLAVEGYDLLDGATNICGLRRLEATVESPSGGELLRHVASWGELDFGVNKDMNAHAFYPVWSSARDQVHRLHRMPTNRLGIYPKDVPADAGWLSWPEGKTVALRVTATDAAGNATTRQVVLLAQSAAGEEEGWKSMDMEWSHDVCSTLPQAAGQCTSGEAALEWEAQTFFEATSMGWKMNDTGMGGALYPTMVPYRKAVQVSWDIPDDVDAWAAGWSVLPGEPWPEDQWLAVKRNAEGQVDAVATATLTSGKVHVSLKEGGAWRLERDTVPPKVLPYHSGTPWVKGGNGVWFVDDALSGVDDITLTFNGTWARVVWDPKRNMVTYEADDAIHRVGEPNDVELVVTDEAGNQTVWVRTLKWP